MLVDTTRRRLLPGLWLLASLLLAAASVRVAAASDISGITFVNHDGSLSVDGRTVHLWGIYIPPTGEACRTFERPPVCAPRAVLALDFRIQGFVDCDTKSVNGDGSVNAVCYVDRTALNRGKDLAAYLLRRGWAVALPDAPIEYKTLEQIARRRGIGIWGIPVVVPRGPAAGRGTKKSGPDGGRSARREGERD